MSSPRIRSRPTTEPITRVHARRVLPAVAQTVRDLLFKKRRPRMVSGPALGHALSAAAERLEASAADRLTQLAPATRTLTHRKRELPHVKPPELAVVEPGRPLELGKLDPQKRYLWIVDESLRFILAPEQQLDLPRKVNHGDLTPGPGGASRGIARAGGELYAKPGPGGELRWVLDLSSSHSFNRMDLQVLGHETLEAVIAHLAAQGSDTHQLEPGANIYDPLFRLAGFGHLIKYYLGVGAPRQ